MKSDPLILKKPVGVVLLNLGGPDSLSAIRPFLYNLFSDREIIRLGPAFMQKPLAYLISVLRRGKTEAAYSLIGGRSPILEITKEQAHALEALLQGSLTEGSADCRVFIAMRYWRPFTKDVVADVVGQGFGRIIALSLYPHYSKATTGSSLSALDKALAGTSIERVDIPSWFNHPIYIDALIETIERGLASFGPQHDDVHVLFSAHSLPVKFIDEGDPYLEHIKGTISAITNKIRINWDLSFQSKSGPVRWLEPSTEAMLEDLAARRVKKLLVVPVSFVSDHIETLYEIDMLYKEMAEKFGIDLRRAESLNTAPRFIAALAYLVINRLHEEGWAV